ncbi:hypothetical protein MWU76_13285 [Gelidibacter sp. F2691]|nr:hypothetical protein [Gelidibacter sp. F2691]
MPYASSSNCISHTNGPHFRYPVYVLELLSPEVLEKAGPTTPLGNAAHPMSPFNGQGANQALLNTLALKIYFLGVFFSII